jgi:hypothetical protein
MVPLSFAVVMPSRGLVHSRTVAAVMDSIADTELAFRGWYLTHDMPIPDAHEHATEVALASGADLLWFVEDDVIPPLDSLNAMIDRFILEDDIVAIDYPVGAAQDGWGCIVRDPAGEIEWVGLGCTLIGRNVFGALPRPWFTTDWRFVREGDAWVAVPVTEPNERRYGQHDIHFCFAARAHGFSIGQVPGMMARHARIERLGAEGTNVGCHVISIRDHIERQYPGPA